MPRIASAEITISDIFDGQPAISTNVIMGDLQTNGDVTSNGRFKISTGATDLSTVIGTTSWNSSVVRLILFDKDKSGTDQTLFYETIEVGDVLTFKENPGTPSDPTVYFTITETAAKSGDLFYFNGTTTLPGAALSIDGSSGLNHNFGWSRSRSGVDGVTSYTWTKYADNATGTSGLSDSSVGKSYIGFAFNKTTPTESNAPSDYTWSRIRGLAGDNSRTVYLFRNGTTTPPSPGTGDTDGFSTTGVAQAINGWATTATVPPAENIIYVASRLLKQINGEGDWLQNGNWEINPASASGSLGIDAPHFAELKLYTNPAIAGAATAPGAPSATITWSTGALSSITPATGESHTWSRTPPTQVATSGDVVYESTLVFIDTTAPFSDTNATGSTPTKGISFSGLVTFNDGAFVVDGGSLTSIDGGNITTGSIKAESLDIDGEVTLTGDQSGFIAGRNSASDFKTDGFFVGKTSANTFQLSHTSVTGAQTSGPSGDLTTGTLQAIIHDSEAGLRLYEPIFYTRDANTSAAADTIITTSSINYTLAGGGIYYISLIGGGGGSSSGANTAGAFVGGTSGGDTSITLSGTTTIASGGSGAVSRTISSIPGVGLVSGSNGTRTSYGFGGQGGFMSFDGSGNATNVGDGFDAPSTSYGASGGSAASYTGSSAVPSISAATGNAGAVKNIFVDLTGLSSVTLYVNYIGAGGQGGTGDFNSGGNGAGGAVVISDGLANYTPKTLTEISNVPYEMGKIYKAKSITTQVVTPFILPPGASVITRNLSGSTPGYLQTNFSFGTLNSSENSNVYNPTTTNLNCNLIQPASYSEIIAITMQPSDESIF